MEKELEKIHLSALYATGKLGVVPGKLTGDVLVPQSKSAAHRALIMAFLSGDIAKAKIDEKNISDDITATKTALLQIEDALRNGTATEDSPLQIDCKESGSTLRFLIPLLAVLGIPSRLTGSGRLPKRPIREYEDVFSGSGARMLYEDTTGLSLPLLIKGKMRAGEYSLPGNVSSQYISGLLMALSAADGPSRITITTELESRPYVDMTREVMRGFGVDVVEKNNGYYLSGWEKPARSEDFEVEADYSQAAFWLVANYLGSSIVLKNLPKKTAQGDRAIETLLSGLMQAGAEGKDFEMDARDVPDLVPVFSIAAAATNCRTRIVHAERLRIKESDRIASTSAMLTALGVKNEITEDGLLIEGKGASEDGKFFCGATVDSCKDHRLVMAASVAATVAKDTVWIKDPGAVEKSYPAFFEDYMDLGGSIYGINVG